jgi:hypothetical protein
MLSQFLKSGNKIKKFILTQYRWFVFQKLWVSLFYGPHLPAKTFFVKIFGQKSMATAI